MSENMQENQVQEQPKTDPKEYNFRALEAKYERQLAQERAAREEAERKAQEALSRRQIQEEDDDREDEPYVDHKKLNKKLSSFERKLEEKIEKKAHEKAYQLVQQERRESWIRQNSDFYDVLQNHSQELANRDPDLAETLLNMPEGFERQKLAYKQIKAMGLDKPKKAESSIQEKVDANRRSPYYQPSGVGTAPYAAAGDFSNAGQKNAYQKMQELKSRLRIN